MSGVVSSKLVKDSIEERDIIGLKGAFVAIIFSDRSFSSGNFDNTLEYVVSETDLKIFESFDGGELLSKKINSGNITEDDFEEAVYNLKVNFCKKRIEDVKKLGEFLYGKNIKSKIITSSNLDGGNTKEKKTHGCQLNKLNAQKESKAGLVAAGIAVAAIVVAMGFWIKSMK